MQLIDVNFRPKFDYVAECDIFLRITHKEGLRDKTCVFIKDLRFEKTMEACMLIVILEVTARLEMIRIRIVNFLIILIEDLELEEVDALLEQVNIAEVLNVEYKLCTGAIHCFAF